LVRKLAGKIPEKFSGIPVDIARPVDRSPFLLDCGWFITLYLYTKPYSNTEILYLSKNKKPNSRH
jgi:hypothetical protein